MSEEPFPKNGIARDHFGWLNLPQTCNTAHSNSIFRSVRIIRPHHPLFGQTVPLVKLWEHKKRRYYVIQLPDQSHTRIPLHWADDGKGPLPEISSKLPALTIPAIKALISIMERLRALNS
jgi:hypothetical protein